MSMRGALGHEQLHVSQQFLIIGLLNLEFFANKKLRLKAGGEAGCKKLIPDVEESFSKGRPGVSNRSWCEFDLDGYRLAGGSGAWPLCGQTKW